MDGIQNTQPVTILPDASPYPIEKQIAPPSFAGWLVTSEDQASRWVLQSDNICNFVWLHKLREILSHSCQQIDSIVPMYRYNHTAGSADSCEQFKKIVFKYWLNCKEKFEEQSLFYIACPVDSPVGLSDLPLLRNDTIALRDAVIKMHCYMSHYNCTNSDWEEDPAETSSRFPNTLACSYLLRSNRDNPEKKSINPYSLSLNDIQQSNLYHPVKTKYAQWLLARKYNFKLQLDTASSGTGMTFFSQISNRTQLEKLCSVWKHNKQIAIHLRQDRNQKVTLLQVFDGQASFLIHGCLLHSSQTFKNLLDNKHVQKLCYSTHAGKALAESLKVSVTNIFDCLKLCQHLACNNLFPRDDLRFEDSARVLLGRTFVGTYPKHVFDNTLIKNTDNLCLPALQVRCLWDMFFKLKELVDENNQTLRRATFTRTMHHRVLGFRPALKTVEAHTPLRLNRYTPRASKHEPVQWQGWEAATPLQECERDKEPFEELKDKDDQDRISTTQEETDHIENPLSLLEAYPNASVKDKLTKKTIPVYSVNSDEGLVAMCLHLKQYSPLGMDTEKDRNKRLALIQVTDGHNVFLIHVVNISEWQPLQEILTSRNIIKIFHNARSDLTNLQQCMPAVRSANDIVDTERLFIRVNAGDPDKSSSLKYALSRILNVNIEKKSGHNWNQYPLWGWDATYAVEDAYYLPSLYHELRSQEEREGRLPPP